MAAIVTILQTKPKKLRREEAAHLRASLKEWEAQATGLPAGLMDVLYRELDKRTASHGRWTFVMISPQQNHIVVRYLIKNSKYPLIALDLWGLCFEHLHCDTGEILLSRDELADNLEQKSKVVSAVMSELEDCGAISRRYEKVAGVKGRGFVRYFMNPLVGTHLPGAARDEAQAKAPKLRLVKSTAASKRHALSTLHVAP
jgi:hypothetical protein